MLKQNFEAEKEVNESRKAAADEAENEALKLRQMQKQQLKQRLKLKKQ